eukprot:SAG31_NODE_10410_length_1141_cov_1.389635_1_plen_212_part_00
MWSLAPKLGALLVFAEHRYEGESFPKLVGMPNCMAHCTSAEALADYAMLIGQIKQELDCSSSPVVAFGGSYGGMLSSWFRIKYPNVVDGAIAASAPIWGLPLTYPKDIRQPPRLINNGASVAIARGVSAAGGATDFCHDNLLGAWSLIKQAAKSPAGRALLSEAFQTCKPIKTEQQAEIVSSRGQGPWFDMAEGCASIPKSAPLCHCFALF